MAADGVDDFAEIGAGKVLTGLVRRIVSGVRAVALGNPADIATFRTLFAS